MSGITRSTLEETIEKGEEQNGNIEFKKQLKRDIHLTDQKRNSLVAQLRHRILSGKGEAKYVIGVDDDGEITGISRNRFDETVDVLSIIAQEADSAVKDVEMWTVGETNNVVGIAIISDNSSPSTSDDEQIVIGTAGHVDHGKSTLVGTLVTGTTDDGQGAVRSYLDVRPHEVERGLSADLSYAVYGFSKDETYRMNNPDRKNERSRIVEQSDRIVSFVDTVGHDPWLSTTIRGLVGQRLDYGLLTVAADEGPTRTTREHLGVLLATDLPTIVAITKSDLVDKQELESVEKSIESLLRDVGCTPISANRYDTETIVNEISENTIPIVRTSAVNFEGIETLDTLFKKLPKRTKDDGEFMMYIDKTYQVEGVGTVVSGTVKSGNISKGDEILIGPTSSGEFLQTKARSIEIHYHRVDSATSGQLISISLQNIAADEIRRGMTLLSNKTEKTPVNRFEADLMVLNHPTSITDGYEPSVHLETINEVASIHPKDDNLLPGERGEAILEFKFNPYVISEGQQFVFREGESKGVGVVTDTIS